jgi:hypothetical protein
VTYRSVDRASVQVVAAGHDDLQKSAAQKLKTSL